MDVVRFERVVDQFDFLVYFDGNADDADDAVFALDFYPR